MASISAGTSALTTSAEESGGFAGSSSADTPEARFGSVWEASMFGDGLLDPLPCRRCDGSSPSSPSPFDVWSTEGGLRLVVEGNCCGEFSPEDSGESLPLPAGNKKKQIFILFFVRKDFL